jgi:uncharacterized protein DUF2752
VRIGTRSIPHPWKDCRSYYYLFSVLAYWGLARNAETLWFPSCPLRFMTGIPCPFCGITTGSGWLARGEILEAWHNNILALPLGIGVLIVAVYTIGWRLAAGYSLALNVDRKQRRGFWIFAGLLVVISWSINLYRYF